MEGLAGALESRLSASSYQSLMPAAAGTPRYGKPELWLGTADSATPHPDPSGGQAPALHSLIPPSAIGLQFGMIRRCRAGIEVDRRARFRTIDETGKSNGCDPSRFGVRDVLSYQ